MTVLRFTLPPKMKPVSPRRSAVVASLDIGVKMDWLARTRAGEQYGLVFYNTLTASDPISDAAACNQFYLVR